MECVGIYRDPGLSYEMFVQPRVHSVRTDFGSFKVILSGFLRYIASESFANWSGPWPNGCKKISLPAGLE